MKQKRLELRLTSLELDRLKLLAAKVELEYGFKVSLQELTRALMQLIFADEPEGGFSSSKGKFGLVGIISNFKGADQKGWQEEKKIKKELESNLGDLDFFKFVEEYESLIEKRRDYRLSAREKSRLEILEKRADKESKRMAAEEAQLRQWQKEGRYRSRRHKYE